MKNNYLLISILFLFILLAGTSDGFSAVKQELKIGKVELGYPCPAIPFYFLKAELELPYPSIMEVEVAVNGKTLRFTNLHKETDTEDLNKPVLTHRPPSGAGLSQDNSIYNKPYVIGWVKWEPGMKYDVKVTVRMKKAAKNSDNDLFVSAVKTLQHPRVL